MKKLRFFAHIIMFLFIGIALGYMISIGQAEYKDSRIINARFESQLRINMSHVAGMEIESFASKGLHLDTLFLTQESIEKICYILELYDSKEYLLLDEDDYVSNAEMDEIYQYFIEILNYTQEALESESLSKNELEYFVSVEKTIGRALDSDTTMRTLHYLIS